MKKRRGALPSQPSGAVSLVVVKAKKLTKNFLFFGIRDLSAGCLDIGEMQKGDNGRKPCPASATRLIKL